MYLYIRAKADLNVWNVVWGHTSIEKWFRIFVSSNGNLVFCVFLQKLFFRRHRLGDILPWDVLPWVTFCPETFCPETFCPDKNRVTWFQVTSRVTFCPDIMWVTFCPDCRTNIDVPTHYNFWQLLATVGNCWQLLATVGNFWQLLATYGNSIFSCF